MKWRAFVAQQRIHLRDAYPCAAPTHRRLCPRHGDPVGPVTRICKPCRDELYQQLAAKYVTQQSKEEPTMTHTPDPQLFDPQDEDHRQPDELLPVRYAPPAPAPGLFGTDNPKTVITRATEISDELARVIRDRKLYASIGGKEHVLVEGWTLLGSMLGVFPLTIWTHKLEDGWEARVEARTLDGRVVGAAESMCTTGERRWRGADDYAVRSMAATRATSKALRQPLGFVMQLAGFDATPADELPETTPQASSRPAARDPGRTGSKPQL
jgi:hypothetical protein